MSFDFRGLRTQSNDPLTQFLVETQKRLTKFLTENQVAALDSENEDIYSDAQDMETAIKWHSDLSGNYQFLFNKEHYPPFEPDYNFLTCWVRGINLGGTTKDWSGFNHTATMFGDPTMVDGSPFDWGIRSTNDTVKSYAVRYNRPGSLFTNQEYFSIPDHADLNITTLTTGYSEFVRFRIFDLETQDGLARTVYEKIDDSTPNYARMLNVRSDGRLVYVVKRGGSVVAAKETSLALISTNNVYDIFVTFTISGSVLHIYVNGIDQTLNNFAGTVNWQVNLTNHDFFGFRRGAGSGGYLNGDFFDYKIYKGMVVTQTDVTRHYTNKWSISNIAFGHVMITNYWGMLHISPPGTGSFSSISFSPASFTIADIAMTTGAFMPDAFEADAFEL